LSSRYTLQFEKRFLKDLKKIPEKDRQRLYEKVIALAEFPRPEGCKKLEGHQNVYRTRSGNYRVVYRIKDKQLLVLVIQASLRRDIYRSY